MQQHRLLTLKSQPHQPRQLHQQQLLFKEDQTDGDPTGLGEMDGQMIWHGMEDGMLRMTSYSEDQKEEDGVESQSSIGTEMELLTGKILQPGDGEHPLGEHQLGDQEEEKSSEPTGMEMVSLMLKTDGEDSENGQEEPGIQHGEETDGEQILSQLEKFQLELNGKIPIGAALKDGIHQFGLNQLGLLQLGLLQLGLNQLGPLQLGDQEEEIL